MHLPGCSSSEHRRLDVQDLREHFYFSNSCRLIGVELRAHAGVDAVVDVGADYTYHIYECKPPNAEKKKNRKTRG